MQGSELVRPQTVEQCVAELQAYFPPELVKWKPSNFKAADGEQDVVPFVDVRAVAERLDHCFGPENWQSRYRQLTGGEVECTLSVRFPTKPDYVERADVGARGSHMAEADDNIKTAYSDAFKRAAVQLGIGRYLYRLPKFRAPVQGKRVRQSPRIPDRFIPDEYHVAGPKLADQALKLALTLCTKTNRDVNQYTADFLARHGYPVTAPLADVQRRHVRALMDRVTADMTAHESSALPDHYPKTAAELCQRVAQHDAKLAKSGACKVGELLAYVSAMALSRGWPNADPLDTTEPAKVRAVVEWVTDFTSKKNAQLATRAKGPKSNPPADTPAQSQTAG